LLGAAVGDAAGAVLEFIGREPTEAEVSQAMAMPGGGCWHVAPGQITDDTELAICLADGLLAGGGVLDLDAVATAYRRTYIQINVVGNTPNAWSDFTSCVRLVPQPAV
jgi:ADP-ribosylglycohydrolase